ncbi:DivIVA domain-containing protein [Paractinoplanes ferrugineus]|uniref:DivIVA domain-containing protein n=1 Tax=Paractinoplanes ferrugineus TaxID=113564 RepID=UPI001943AF3E|nr:hypothetical protein [Actinoplanes ferrugineus]
MAERGPAESSTPAVETDSEALMSPDEALQVLALAQRTAENHITAANRQAQEIRSTALATAEKITNEAHSYADEVRLEADRLLDGSRAAAELRNRDAEAQAAATREQAAAVLAEARAEAARIVAQGHERAEQLDLQAQLRYEDSVGCLDIKRQALQNQIEALTNFDAEYRQRLATFMHAQLRALWIEHATAGETADAELQLPGGPVAPLAPDRPAHRAGRH